MDNGFEVCNETGKYARKQLQAKLAEKQAGTAKKAGCRNPAIQSFTQCGIFAPCTFLKQVFKSQKWQKKKINFISSFAHSCKSQFVDKTIVHQAIDLSRFILPFWVYYVVFCQQLLRRAVASLFWVWIKLLDSRRACRQRHASPCLALWRDRGS